MTLFDRLFYSGAMQAVFSDENRLQRMLDFESALARAEASAGLISADVAEAIAEACKVENLNLAAIREDAGRAANLAIPLVGQLTAHVEKNSLAAARFVHWGATSQDAIDTGLVLQMREGLRLIDGQLQQLNEGLADLAQRYADTVMAGRTWLQHAVPVTFGWKAAAWLDALLRQQAELREVAVNSLALQFGGAAGTLASLRGDGAAVAATLAESLGLAQPDISWHSSRDRVATIVTQLGVLTGTLGKMARDLSLLMQTEVAEVSEGQGAGRGGSSTMPQKRNPVACSAVLAAAGRVPGLVANALAAMAQEHERGLGNWQVEWETIPEVFALCGGALARMNELIAGLEVDADRMKENLKQTRGLIYAEAVSMALAAHVGKPEAHSLVERLCGVAADRKRHLRDVLGEDAEAMRLLSPSEIERLFDAKQYLGNSRAAIDRVLTRASASGVATESGWVESVGALIRFRISGAKHLPVLVLSNSLGSDMTAWDAQIAEFAPHFRLLRYDTRGHGHSSATAGPYSMDLLGRDVLALLDALAIEDCRFCGISMGGMIGQWLGIHAALRVRKLVLCNTAALIGTREGWDARIDAVQTNGMSAIASGVLERWFTPPFLRSQPGLMAKTRAAMEATSVAGYVGCCEAIRDADFRESAKEIRISTLVVAGTHDPATPAADGRLLADSIAGARFVELNASHLSNVEADKKFNAAVLEFLLG